MKMYVVTVYGGFNSGDIIGIFTDMSLAQNAIFEKEKKERDKLNSKIDFIANSCYILYEGDNYFSEVEYHITPYEINIIR